MVYFMQAFTALQSGAMSDQVQYWIGFAHVCSSLGASVFEPTMALAIMNVIILGLLSRHQRLPCIAKHVFVNAAHMVGTT